MKLVTIQCPACGASLQIDDGLDTFYCQYCGNKIFMADQSPETIKARLRVKELKHSEVMQDKAHAHEINKINIQNKESKRGLKVAIIGFIVSISILIIMAIIYHFSDNDQDKKLTRVVSEIQLDLANEDYDSALIKANSLYFTGDSNELEKKWDNMRNSIISTINEAKKGK